MTLYLIATALVFFFCGYAYSSRRWSTYLDHETRVSNALRSKIAVISDAFNHILKQRNDLQAKLNELTK